MKKIQAVKARIISFIILIIFAALLVVPARNKIISLENLLVNKLTAQVEKSTNLKISFESFSPSILSAFYIQGIELSDKENNEILTIEKVRVRYNLFKLLHKDFQKGIENVTIDGISLDVEKLLQIVKMFSSPESEKQTQFDFEQLKTKIPSLIKLKNISLKYVTPQISAGLFLKEVAVNNNVKKGAITFNLDSHAYVNPANLNEKIYGNISINGQLPDGFENSHIYFNFTDLAAGQFKFNKLNLVAAYAQNKISLCTIQTENPINLTAEYNLSDGVVNAELVTDKLIPSSIISSNQKKLEQFKNMLIDTQLKFSANLKDKTAAYYSKGGISLAETFIPKGMEVSYSVSGNEKHLNLESLSVKSEKYQAEVELDYIFSSMQVSGFADLPYILLPNGNVVSTEIYFDPLKKGFMAFSPQLFVGEKALTAIQLSFMPQKDSYDFVLEAYDYSHAGNFEPGLIKVDGSYLLKNNYLQGGVAFSSFFMDSVLDFGSQLVDSKVSKTLTGLKDSVSDFMFSGDVYASTDFKSISYNVPYIILANTKKDNQFLMVSANGNDQTIQLDQLSFILGKFAFEASASLDRNPDTSDMFFTADIKSDSVPYHFTGTIMPEIVTVTGDYDTDIEIRFDSDKNIKGHAVLRELPVSYVEKSAVISAQTEFNYDVENGPVIAVKQLQIEGAGAKKSVNPKLLLAGNVTKYGAQLNSIAYTDFYSALEGTADVMVNINDGILDSVGLIMNVKNPLSEEAVIMDATVSNPEHLKLDSESIKDSLYINSQMQINKFGLNRFTEQKNDNNLLTASLFASGTINHPYVAVSIDDFSMIMAGVFINTTGSFTLEDKLFSINQLNLNYQQIHLTDLAGSFSLEDFTGFANGKCKMDANGKEIVIPLTLNITDTVMKKGSILPESTVVTLSSKEIGGSFMKKTCAFDLSAIYNNKAIALFSSDNLGILGNITQDGHMSITMNSQNKVKLNVSGVVNSKETNIKVHDVYGDMKYIFSFLNLDDVVLFDNGILQGSVSVLNSLEEPVLKGAMLIDNPVLSLPTMIQRKISAPKTLITIINNEIRFHNTEYFVKGSNSAFVGATIFMNKWNVDHIDLGIDTKGKTVTTKFITPAITIAGEVDCDLKVNFTGNDINTSGKLFAENATVYSDIQAISSDTANPNGGNVIANMDITLGNHATLNFEPLLRCVFVPNTHFSFAMDMNENLYEIDGKFDIRSGDIAYLSRSFYIKDGSIKFNKSDFTNPALSITAETREKDENGDNVRIILSAENQYLQDFNPKFSSNPPKSENEIMTLLGQIAVADSKTATNFLISAGDYALQSAVTRKAENKLREVLNFDIFSIRTNVIQNTLNLSMNNQLSGNNITFGNFLDNSTVYVGKYLGSSIYFDAMIHFSYEDVFARNMTSTVSLFQPEFGLELESPLENLRLNLFPNSNALISGNIRMNMAPDINALMNNQIVPSSSLTFTVKMAF